MTQRYFDIIDESNSALISTINKQKIASTQYFPIFGFSQINDGINHVEILKEYQRANLNRYISSIYNKRTNNHSSVSDILDDESIAPSYKCQAIMYSVSNGQIPLEDFEHYLRFYPESKDNSDYRRMICLYDLLKYGNE
jgi:hypothetical protein